MSPNGKGAGSQRPATRTSRLVTGAFGVLLLVLAVATVLVVEPDIRWRGMILALLLAVLGIDALVASVRGTASMLSRIGPLP